MVYNSAKSAVTVTADYSSATLKASDYESSVVTITAATRTNALNIEGNAKANRIIGTSANDTLSGAAGNDTLTGGDGADIFIYDGKGADVITDYAAGEDTLKISSGSVSSYTISGSDATFKIGSGSIKVSGGKNKAITVIDSKNKVTTYDGGLIYDGTVAKAKAMTVSAAYGNTLASYGASVVTIDASARTKALNITGNAAANKITGTSANDTINGGAGNDTLYGGKGKDLFVYESGDGNDVIADYTAGQDTIKISGDSVSAYSISGSDAVLKVGTGSIKVRGGKTAAVLVVDDNKKASLYQNGAVYNAASSTKATAITLTSGYGNSFTAGTSAISVDASPRTSAINITGNTKNNFLVGGSGKDIIDGGKGADSITGGKGADVLTGGAGRDVFIYANGDGSDVITDYVSGEDLIKLTSGEVKDYSVKNGDAVLKIGSGAITLKGAGTDAVSVLDENDVLTVYRGGLIYNQPDIGAADVVTITSDYDGKFNSYGASVETIDAAARTKAIEITGNGADNFIFGGKGKDTISAGKGSDTIIGGKGNDLLTGGDGADVFVYATGDGNDTIMDYGAGDIVSLDGASLTSYSTKGNDAVLKIGTGNVTLKDAADIAITLVGADSVASIYNGDDFSTQLWTGGAGMGTPGVFPPETVTVEVTVEVTLPPVTETVEVEVTLPAETITVGGGEVITSTMEAATLYGTAGNDTLTGGEGADVFVYTGGNDFDVITNYGTGADKISIGSNSVSGGAVIGSDVFFMINGGVLKLLDAKDKAVTIISGDTENEYVNGAVPGGDTTPADSGVTVTLDSTLSGSFSLTSYNTTAEIQAVNIDASDVVNSINLYGDNSTNVIHAGRAGGWIYSGAGDDVIYCGNGNDTIAHYSNHTGNKIIYNYRAEDVIWLQNGAPCSSFSFSSDDVILNMANGGTITLKDSKDKSIHIMQNVNGTYYTYDLTRTIGRVTFSGDTVSLASNYIGVFYLTSYADEVANIDASNATGSIELHADDSDNIIRAAKGGSNIYAGRGDDTIYSSNAGGWIYAGAGDDVIYCGNGNDTIAHYSDYTGNKIVYNYRAEDVIWLQAQAPCSSFSFSGDDVILNMTNGATITLKDSKDKSIHIMQNVNGTYYTYDLTRTIGRVTFSGDTVSLASNYIGAFYLTSYADEAANIDASNATGSIELHADDSDNIIRAAKGGSNIYAGRGDDTIYCSNAGGWIYAGAGDDVIYCGNGNDTIAHYSDYTGNKIVYNYRAEDVIWLEKDTGLNHSLDGDDVILNMANGGTITLKDSRDKSIHIMQRANGNYYAYDLTRTIGRVTFSGDTVSLASNYIGVFYLTSYTEEAANIDASNATGSIELHADDSDNVIRAAKGGSNIYAGKGDDTIYCGHGNDTIRFYQYDGDETVYNIGDNDQIILNNCTAQNVSVNGSDVVITTSSDETITLKDGTGKRIGITGQGWQTYTAINGNAAVPWFAEDDLNFTTTADLDSLMDNPSAITSLNFSATTTDSLFAPELAYTGEK